MERPKVIVVNTDPIFLQLIDDVLTEQGYNTIPCKESRGVYQAIREQRPDLIILDIRLSNPEEGWQLLEVLKFDPETKDIPIIVASADRLFLQAKEAHLRDKGCFILEKPFELDDLLAVIKKAEAARHADGDNC
jgi:CheY-like chemotaxis protein